MTTKAEVLNAFYTSVFKSQNSYSQGTPDLEVWDGKQNKLLIIQVETIKRATSPPGLSQVIGAGWDPPRSVEEADRGDCQDAFHHVLVFLAN